MPILKTVLTYSRQIEAELDQSVLQAEGIAVFLLNHDSPLTEYGGAFQVQLQVPEEDHLRATMLLKSANPERFGSRERVQKEAKAIAGIVRRFLVCFVAISIVFMVFLAKSIFSEQFILVSLFFGFISAIPVSIFNGYLRKKTKAD